MAIDDVDRKVVDALLSNARANVEELSASAGVSAPVVEQRLDDLEEREVVTGYEPRVDYEAFGYDVTAVLRITADPGLVDGAGHDELAARLADDDRLGSVYAVTGEFDVVAVGKFRDLTSMHERVGELVATAGIRDVTTDVVRETIAEHERFPVSDGGNA